jgi:metal-sulfur cluster biosynthetic enzyme
MSEIKDRQAIDDLMLKLVEALSAVYDPDIEIIIAKNPKFVQ